MEESRIRALVAQLDISRQPDEQAAWNELKALGKDVVPYLADAFPHARRWQQRVAFVFHSIRFARDSEPAYQLGLLALSDRSSMVRFRACGLLAYSLRRDALPALKKLLDHSDARTVEDARAAIDALTHNNHHYFVDRTHTHRSFWVVNPEDQSRDA
jgi:hypothetical protein